MSGLSVSDKQKIMNSVPNVVDALREILPTINPLLENTTKVDEFRNWVETLVQLVSTEPFDREQVIDLGQQLEVMDSFQPADLLRALDTLHHTFVHNLPEELQLVIYPRLLTAISAVISGFYIGKARRASAIDMSAAAKMGHDLKTPINAITGFSHVILKEIDGPITPFQKEDLTSIYEAGKKLLVMINDLSAVWKQDANHFGIYPANFKVSDVVADVMANIHPLCASAGHTLCFNLERDLGTIQGDASKVRWILLCLLLYLSHQGNEWKISISAKRKVISDNAFLVFRIEGGPADTPLMNHQDEKQVTSTEMINRDVGLATSWRFCSSIGARLSMFEGYTTAFDLLLPAQFTSSDVY